MKMVPLISSGVAGPLGVLHLPRLWLKVSLDAAGKLHPDYPAIGHGFDKMVLDGLGLDQKEFEQFMHEHHPSYPQLEAWILEQKGGKLDPGAVAKLNAAIISYEHDYDTRRAVLKNSGLPEAGGRLKDAVSLNNLDDWQIFYEEELALAMH